MTVALKFAKDARGYNTFAATPADTIVTATLTVGSAQSTTVPSGADFYTVAFNYQPGGIFWVDVSGSTASVPAGATFASATSVLNPSTYLLPAGTSAPPSPAFQ